MGEKKKNAPEGETGDLFSPANEKPVTIIWIFFVIGLILATVAVVFLFTRIPLWHRVPVEAEIVRIETYQDEDGDTQHRTLVSYYADGVRHTWETSYHSVGFRVGKTLSAYYDSRDPSRLGLAGQDRLLVGAFLVMAAVFLRLGIRPSRKLRLSGLFKRSKHTQQDLRKTGKRIEAYYEGLEASGSSRVVLCRWLDPETGVNYEFRSRAFYGNPDQEIRARGITRIPVLIDPDDPKHYLVDLNALQKTVSETPLPEDIAERKREIEQDRKRDKQAEAAEAKRQKAEKKEEKQRRLETERQERLKSLFIPSEGVPKWLVTLLAGIGLLLILSVSTQEDTLARIILFAMGGAFLFIGIRTFIKYKLYRRVHSGLRNGGKLIEASFTGVENGVTVNGAPSFHLLCRWVDPENGKEHRFRSPLISGDPSAEIRSRKGLTVPVWIAPRNPKRYYVDLNELENRLLEPTDRE